MEGGGGGGGGGFGGGGATGATVCRFHQDLYPVGGFIGLRALL